MRLRMTLRNRTLKPFLQSVQLCDGNGFDGTLSTGVSSHKWEN